MLHFASTQHRIADRDNDGIYLTNRGYRRFGRFGCYGGTQLPWIAPLSVEVPKELSSWSRSQAYCSVFAGWLIVRLRFWYSSHFRAASSSWPVIMCA